jgi:hypothetical protein
MRRTSPPKKAADARGPRDRIVRGDVGRDEVESRPAPRPLRDRREANGVTSELADREPDPDDEGGDDDSLG